MNQYRVKPPRGILPNLAHPSLRGLIGWWLFQEGSGDRVYDLSGDRNTGTLNGFAVPATKASGWGAGLFGGTLLYDETNDYVDITYSKLKLTGSHTISIWMKLNVAFSAGVHQTIFGGKGLGSANAQGGIAFTFFGDIGTLYYDIYDATGRASKTDGALGLDDNAWHLIIGTWDGTNQTLYVDGKLISTGAGVAGSLDWTGSNDVLIGSGGDPATRYPFNGLIDDVRIYNRALSAIEVKDLFENPFASFTQPGTERFFVLSEVTPPIVLTRTEPPNQFFLQEGGGFIRDFKDKNDLFSTFGGADAAIFTSNAEKERCMVVSTGGVDRGADEYVSDLIPDIHYVFDMAYRVSAGTWRANLYDNVNGATAWAATSLTSTNWANVYHRVTMPNDCSVLRIRLQQVVSGGRLYVAKVALQGNALYRDPDGYGIDWPKTGITHRTANGNRVRDVGALHAGFTMNFPNITVSAMHRLAQLAQQKAGAWFDDGNAVIMTAWGTTYASTTYDFSGATQGGGGATLFKALTNAIRPVGSAAMESTEMANSQYAAIGTDNNTAVTLAITETGKYGYIKMNFVATQYATTADIRKFSVQLKGDANDLARGDVDGVDMFAWDGAQWLMLARSKSPDKRTLRYATTQKEIARKLINSNKIRLIAKTRGEKEISASNYMHLYHVNVAVNDKPVQVYLKNKAIPTAAGAVGEVKNMTTKALVGAGLGYNLADDRESIIVNADFVSANLNGSSQFFYRDDTDFPESGITGDMTIQGWIKLGDLNFSTIAAKYAGGGDKRMYLLGHSIVAGELSLFVSSDGTIGNLTSRTSTNANFVIGIWYHIAVTYDANDASCIFYKNGVALTDNGGVLKTSIADKDPPFTIGADDDVDFYKGGLSKFALFTDIRTPAEIATSYNNINEDLSSADNIIATWDFDDNAAATAIDNTQGDAGRDLIPYDGGDVAFGACGRTISASIKDIIRVKYNQYYNVAIEQLAEPTIYGGDVSDPRGVGAARLITLRPID